jgi:hypothetical protein
MSYRTENLGCRILRSPQFEFHKLTRTWAARAAGARSSSPIWSMLPSRVNMRTTQFQKRNFESLKSEAEGKFLELIFDRVPCRVLCSGQKTVLCVLWSLQTIFDLRRTWAQLSPAWSIRGFWHVTRDGDARVPWSGLWPRQRLRQRQNDMIRNDTKWANAQSL